MNAELKSLVFSFECHKDWKTLTLTDDTAVRFCDECNKMSITAIQLML